jgi:hypothetical protein
MSVANAVIRKNRLPNRLLRLRVDDPISLGVVPSAPYLGEAESRGSEGANANLPDIRYQAEPDFLAIYRVAWQVLPQILLFI